MTDKCIFSPVPVAYIRLVLTVQRLSYVDKLNLLCIFNRYNMKNNFYIDSMDLLHFGRKKNSAFIIYL